MKLVLHAISLNESDLSPPIIGEFEESGGTIGRSDNASMTLPDPARLVSRIQANVSYGGSLFWLEDIGSANPVLHNGLPLGNGVKVPLKGNDELRIGGYRIIVQVEGAAAPAPAPLPERAAALPLTDLLGPESRDRRASGANPFADVLRIDSDLAMPMPGTPRLAPPAPPSPDAVREVREAREQPAQPPALPRKPKPLPPRVPAAAPPPEPARNVARIVEPPAEPPPAKAKPAPLREKKAPVIQPPPPVAPTPAAAAARRASSPAPAAESAYSADDIWRGFLEGAEVDVDLPRGVTPELMRTAGVMLRAAVEGMLDLIAVRAAAKNELHAPMTMIQVRENNPLKFSPDATVALTQLLQPPGRGFMPGPDAVRDAMVDLQSHQLGTMAGMRAALGGLLERFDPALLEARLSRHSMLDTLLPPSRKARLWDLFLQHYHTIRKDAEDDYHELFGKAFVEAYAAAVERLTREPDVPPGTKR